MTDRLPTKRDPKTNEELELQEVECSTCDGTGDHPRGIKDRCGETLFCPDCDGCGKRKEWRPKKTV